MAQGHPSVHLALGVAGLCALVGPSFAQAPPAGPDASPPPLVVPAAVPVAAPGPQAVPQSTDTEVPREPKPRPKPGSPRRAMGPGYDTAATTLYAGAGITFASSVVMAVVGGLDVAFGCAESHADPPAVAAPCGDTGRALLYSALGVSFVSLSLYITGRVLRSCCSTAAQQQAARASRLRLEPARREPPWTVPPAERRPARSGLALSLSF